MDKIHAKRKWDKLVRNDWEKFDSRVTVSAVLRQLGSQAPYFSLTYSSRDGGGAGHDYIVELFPTLQPYVKWHLCDWTGAPMHYIANAMYHAGGYHDRILGWVEPAWDAFKRHINLGAVEGDDLIDDVMLIGMRNRGVLRHWLETRLSGLRRAFDADMHVLLDVDLSQMRADWQPGT